MTPASDGGEAYRAPVGTHDVLPPESGRWTEVVRRFADRARRGGFGLVVSPVFEHLEVFQRVGEATDVVRKEMYEFSDRGDRRLVLRPEATASVVRAFVQHSPPVPWKVWYVAPLMRYERPQRGRFRQHHQLGVEVLGTDDPGVDVEVIALAAGFLRDLGLRDLTLLLNSLGDDACRPAYLERLRSFLAEHEAGLCDDSRSRYPDNPLRVLDCKRPQCVEITEKAPALFEHLCDPCRRHFERVQHGLETLGLKFEIAPRLVRGLDYYTRTAFEFVSDALDAAQSTVCGGGRYDRLAEAMGGRPAPGMGFGLGIERLLIVCDAEQLDIAPHATLDAFVIDALGVESGGADPALLVLDDLREAGLAADRAYGGRSVKAQMKAADRSGAAFAVVVAPDELARGVVVVRDLGSSEQVEVAREDVARWLVGHRSGAPRR
jgi:histidyl-tRNA synthetase